MKYRLRTLIRHKLGFLLILTAVLCISDGVWGLDVYIATTNGDHLIYGWSGFSCGTTWPGNAINSCSATTSTNYGYSWYKFSVSSGNCFLLQTAADKNKTSDICITTDNKYYSYSGTGCYADVTSIISQRFQGSVLYLNTSNFTDWESGSNVNYKAHLYINQDCGNCSFIKTVSFTSTGTSHIYSASIESDVPIMGIKIERYEGSSGKNNFTLNSFSQTDNCAKVTGWNAGEKESYSACTEPTADIATATQTKCVGGSFTSITVSIEGTVSSYQWKVSTDGSSYSNVSDGEGGATATFTPSSATPGTRYYKCTVSGCNTSVTTANFVTCTTNGVAISSVSPAVGNIHEYVPTTFTASGSATWSISEVPDGVENDIDAYLSSTSGASTIFKGAKGTSGSYKVRATANGCDTDTTFSVAEWDDDCN